MDYDETCKKCHMSNFSAEMFPLPLLEVITRTARELFALILEHTSKSGHSVQTTDV